MKNNLIIILAFLSFLSCQKKTDFAQNEYEKIVNSQIDSKFTKLTSQPFYKQLSSKQISKIQDLQFINKTLRSNKKQVSDLLFINKLDSVFGGVTKYGIDVLSVKKKEWIEIMKLKQLILIQLELIENEILDDMYLFNKFDPVIIPEKSVYKKGEIIELKIVSHAENEQFLPFIYFCNYDSTYSEEGKWVYEIIWENVDSIPLENGVGDLRLKSSTKRDIKLRGLVGHRNFNDEIIFEPYYKKIKIE